MTKLSSLALNLLPNYLDLFITSDIALTSQFYIIQKTSHMLTFGLLYTLYFRWWKKTGFALLVTSAFASFYGGSSVVLQSKWQIG